MDEIRETGVRLSYPLLVAEAADIIFYRTLTRRCGFD